MATPNFDIDKWLTGLLKPSLAGEMVSEENRSLGGGIALLSADTDRTQAFVFESPRLTEIRGASMLLDELNTKGLPKLLTNHGLPAALIPDGCLVYVGGGSLMALVPGDLAPALVEDIEALYPQRTDTATITAVARIVDPQEIGPPKQGRESSPDLAALRKKLGEKGWSRILQAHDLDPKASLNPSEIADARIRRLMANQALALKQRKKAKELAPLIEAIPYARRCRSCGRRPVTNFLTGIEGEEPRPLCRVCYRHAKEGIDGRSDWLRQFAEAKQVKIDPVNDLSDIGAKSKARSGYVGFIYADGDSLGRYLESASSLNAYSQMSQQIAGAMRQATFDALYEHLGENGTCRPFEIITIGGDDALLIVPGDAALPVALSISRAFARILANGRKKTPTMSAGVVIAHDSNPVYFLREMAYKLLRSAKKGKAQKGQGCIDFLVLKSQSVMATDVKDVRSAPALYIEDEESAEITLLTGLPYTLDEIDQLLQSVRTLKNVTFSPGQLHALRRNLRQGRLAGLIYYLYQRTRMKTDARTALAEVEKIWGMDMDNEVPPWRVCPPDPPFQVFDTPFLDILEVREFVLKKEDAVASKD